MRRHFIGLALAAFLALTASPAFAQDDVLSRARTAATRPQGLALLEAHLADTPRDVDARLLYGLMLSWEGRYDEARREFGRVLEQSPGYADARAGLMNVEWWSGRTSAARDQVNLILSRDPGHQQARFVRQRLDASNRPWTFSTSASHDRFSDGRRGWNEQLISLSRQTGVGSLVLRGSHADRFGASDQQFEAEFYPTLRAGTYAFVGVGVAPDHALYPSSRVAFDLYQSLGHGVEVSGGYRRLNFSETTDIYVATLTKYLGNWMLTSKVFHVPGEGSLDSTSAHTVVRRYFGSEGSSFAGIGYSHGLSREEVRGVSDLLMLNNDTVRGQFDALMTDRLRLQLDASTSRQQRAYRQSLWQTSLGVGVAVRF